MCAADHYCAIDPARVGNYRVWALPGVNRWKLFITHQTTYASCDSSVLLHITLARIVGLILNISKEIGRHSHYAGKAEAGELGHVPEEGRANRQVGSAQV
jgi:hypothetical protein